MKPGGQDGGRSWPADVLHNSGLQSGAKAIGLQNLVWGRILTGWCRHEQRKRPLGQESGQPHRKFISSLFMFSTCTFKHYIIF